MIQRSGWLRRLTPLKRSNPKRRRERFRRDYAGEYADHVRMMPCLACGKWPSVAAHVRHGAYREAERNLVPLCWYHHAIQHQLGNRLFEERFRLCLKREAARLWESFHGGAA